MPDRHVIPEDVRQFISENIDSIAQLEGLLLLRANPSEKYNAQDVAARLYIAKAEAEKLLRQLHDRGFLFKGDNPLYYMYQPKSEQLSFMIKRLEEAYTQYLLPVTHFIHSRSKLRVREFANAFRLRKD